MRCYKQYRQEERKKDAKRMSTVSRRKKVVAKSRLYEGGSLPCFNVPGSLPNKRDGVSQATGLADSWRDTCRTTWRASARLKHFFSLGCVGLGVVLQRVGFGGTRNHPDGGVALSPAPLK